MLDSKLLRLAMSVLVVMLATGLSLAEERPDAARLATRFAKLFFAGENEEARSLMTAQMSAAMTAEQSGQLRDGLTGSNGAVIEISI